MLNRRHFIQFGAIASTSLFTPYINLRASIPIANESITRCSANLLAPPPPFQLPLYIPEVLQPTMSTMTSDHYYLTSRPGKTEIINNKVTDIWGYHGKVPGPTIKAKAGRECILLLHNLLPVPVSTHVHGMITADTSDGHPQDLVKSFIGKKVYNYPNNQNASTLWYHDHRMSFTAEQVYAGLAGFYIIEDDVLETPLNLPQGEYDIPLMLTDKTLNDDSELSASLCHEKLIPGRAKAGRMILVNGRHAPYLEVEARTYRFRLLNASNLSWFTLFLQNSGGVSGVPAITVIATDQGLLPSPVILDMMNGQHQLHLSPSERIEMVIDFSAYSGSRIQLLNSGSRTDGVDPQDSLHVMEFRVSEVVTNKAVPLDWSLPFTRLEERVDVSKIPHRTVVLDNINDVWLINGEHFGMAPENASFQQATPHTGFDDIQSGGVEKWTVINRFGKHPFHIHVSRFQVLSRSIGGVMIHPSDWMNPWERDSWKDTVAINFNETVEILVEFGKVPAGIFVFHCHNLEHEDHDMMANMRIIV